MMRPTGMPGDTADYTALVPMLVHEVLEYERVHNLVRTCGLYQDVVLRQAEVSHRQLLRLAESIHRAQEATVT